MINGRNGVVKMRNRLVAIFFVLFVITGCQNDNNAPQMTGLEESFRNMGGETMTRQVSVYVGEDKLLHMYERKQNDNIVLCDKANCTHEPYDESKNPDPVCDAALNKELFSSCVPVISGEYLYLFGEANLSQGVVYRENLDGSGRTRMYTMDYQLEMAGSVYVENNIAYAEVSIPIVNEDNLGGAGTNNGYSLLLQINLESGDTKELSPIRKEKFQSISLLDKKENHLYYVFSYRKLRKKDKDYSTAPEYCTVYEYDMKTGKQTRLFTENELMGMSPVGITEQALCVFDSKTGEAFEISLKDKSKKSIYQPANEDVMYLLFENRWVVGDVEKEQFYYLENKELKQLPDVVSFAKTFGDYAEFYKKDGTCQAVYGSSFFTDEKEIILERK
jgi:hypothetical protein